MRAESEETLVENITYPGIHQDFNQTTEETGYTNQSVWQPPARFAAYDFFSRRRP